MAPLTHMQTRSNLHNRRCSTPPNPHEIMSSYEIPGKVLSSTKLPCSTMVRQALRLRFGYMITVEL
jgi:hypothetical protein